MKGWGSKKGIPVSQGTKVWEEVILVGRICSQSGEAIHHEMFQGVALCVPMRTQSSRHLSLQKINKQTKQTMHFFSFLSTSWPLHLTLNFHTFSTNKMFLCFLWTWFTGRSSLHPSLINFLPVLMPYFYLSLNFQISTLASVFPARL